MKLFGKSWGKLFAAAGCAALSLSVASAAEMTALQLVKEANKQVGDQAKDKVVQIRSEKSIGSLTPNIWYVVLYDPTATFKATEVKFGAGQVLSVKRPMRVIETVNGGDAALDRDKLKVDSDQAEKTALAEDLLKNLKIDAVSLKLERVGEGVLGISGPGQGVWKVRIWANKLRDPSRDADIGEVWVSAFDGKAIKTDLHIDRVD
jgi:hypothetical protein